MSLISCPFGDVKMKFFFIVLAMACSFAEEPSKSPPTLGIFENFYSKSDWTWIKDSGTGLNLKHKTIEDCRIGINIEPWGYEQRNWCLKDTIKTLGKTQYHLFRIEFNGYLWCYTYTPVDESLSGEQLNVYVGDSCKACLEAVEKIISEKK